MYEGEDGIFSDDLVGKINHDKRANLQLLHCRVESWPHFKAVIIEMFCTSRVEAISSNAFKIHPFHKVFEEERVEGIKLDITCLDGLTVSYLNSIVLAVEISLVSLIVLDKSVGIDVAITEDVKLEVFHDFILHTSQHLPLYFAVDWYFRIEGD